MPYRAKVWNLDSSSDASRVDDNAAAAVYEATKASGTITPVALVIGVIAMSLIGNDVTGDARRHLEAFLDSAQIPLNMKELVGLARGE